MRKVISFFVVIMIAQLSFSQGLVKGVVVDKATNETLVGVSVLCSSTGAAVTTSLDGSFAIKLPTGKQEIVINYIGYTQKKLQVSSNEPDLGTIILESEAIGLNDVTVTSSVAIRRKTPVALSVIDPIIIENKLGTQEFPEILKSTPGVYATKQGGGFGDSRINLRGFEAANIAVMVNGVPVNDMEWGGVYWSNWAGLSDVTRSMQVQRGLGASKVAAPSLGGSINIVTRSTDAKKGGAASYGIGNDGYEKIGFSASTGLMANNWAITLLGSKTTGNGYIQGTEFEAYSYFVNISKKINDNQQLSFTAFGAPQWHNQRNTTNSLSSTDKLTIDQWQKQPLKYKYNPSYGFDMNGQRKVSVYNYYHKPQISLNHFWTIDEKSSLSTALYMSIGNGGGSAGEGYTSTDRTNFNGASNGYVNNITVDNTYNLRSEDGTFNYGSVYALNKASINGSRMVMSNSINKHIWYGLLSNYSTKIGQNIDLSGGLDLRYYRGTHTNEITDLYGGKFFIDDADISGTTNKLVVGDVLYRDYDGYIASQGLFGQAEYNKDGLSAFVSISGSNTANWRYERYYALSKSRSDTKNFLGYSAKGGANYNIDEHHNVFANIGIISRAPFFSGGVFLNSTSSNVTNPNAVNEKAFSAELGYGFKSRFFTANLNVYRTKWMDKTMVRYVTVQDIHESLVANIQGVDALHQGVELDFVAKPIKDMELTGMISIGDWNWLNNASGYLYNAQNQPVDLTGNVVELLGPTHAKMDVNLKGIHVGNSAQTTAAVGLNYQVLKGIRIGFDGNYFGRNYSYYNVSSIGSSLASSTYSQPWMIPDAVTLDFNANYHFKVGEFDASLTGNIENLLDSHYITDAIDGSDHTYKTAAVYYGFGRTWSTTLKIKF
jgi:hypothetical protein